ncbi:MAG: hypothetical protein ACLPZM_04225 [Thermoplasmata archaeon]
MPNATLGELLLDVWRQVLAEGKQRVDLSNTSYPVTQTRSRGLRMVFVKFGDRTVEGIEQNPEKTSTWAKRASQGERIMQFKANGRYIGVVAEGTLTRYPAWKAQELPE